MKIDKKRTLQTIAGVFCLVVLWGAPNVSAQCNGTRKVTFPPGLNTVELTGTIPASKAICYELRGRAGQKMTLQVTSPARGVLLTVIPEGFDVEPIAQDIANWEGTLDATGSYTISVHAPRAGAGFTLLISIAGAAPRTTPARPSVTSCGNFSGVYQTDYGPLRLTRTGDQVKGSYTTDSEKDSSLSGTVRGNVLTGRWSDPSGKGTFKFTLAADGRSFKGSFAPDGVAASGGWNGHCGGGNSH